MGKQLHLPDNISIAHHAGTLLRVSCTSSGSALYRSSCDGFGDV